MSAKASAKASAVVFVGEEHRVRLKSLATGTTVEFAEVDGVVLTMEIPYDDTLPTLKVSFPQRVYAAETLFTRGHRYQFRVESDRLIAGIPDAEALWMVPNTRDESVVWKFRLNRDGNGHAYAMRQKKAKP